MLTYALFVPVRLDLNPAKIYLTNVDVYSYFAAIQQSQSAFEQFYSTVYKP